MNNSAKATMMVGVLVLAISCLTMSPASTAQLPPAIEADRMLVRAERQIKDGDFAAALETLDGILSLQEKHDLEVPVEFWFKHAQVAQQAGKNSKAASSALLYLEKAGQQGEHYLEALRLLDEADEEVRKAVDAAEKEQAAKEEMKEKRIRAERRARQRKQRAEKVAQSTVSAGFQPGMHFKECGACPLMVVLPPGHYYMGGFGDDNSPAHPVVISDPFAVSKYELAFLHWDACVADGGCNGHRPNDQGWGRDSRPVVAVSWDDAISYVTWLSLKTGAKYRLLSESEWEYSARASTVDSTNFSWGDDLGRDRANCDGCGSLWDDEMSAPVGNFAANNFGLHDMHGNVQEWVQDCWKNNYVDAPSDGAAWELSYCAERVTRGGSFSEPERAMRSSERYWGGSSDRYSNVGFRVARDLVPIN